MNWFGVKMIFQYKVSGKPNPHMRHYDEKHTIYEERIIIVRAQSLDSALKKSEKEALIYEDEITNLYGQKVKTVFLDGIEAFEIDGNIDEDTEVFSSIIIEKNTNKREMLNKHFGLKLSNEKEERILHKIQNKDFNKGLIQQLSKKL